MQTLDITDDVVGGPQTALEYKWRYIQH